ncbi:MAG TPA: hypothetical protein VJU52_09995 [Flavobacterium sp.]|nr:hypothetical protein [Flavobacterium sp.]
MKRKLYILVAAIALGSIFSCEPIEDRDSLPGVSLTPETLKFSVVQNPQKNNEVKLTNLDPTVIPYWSYSDSKGEIGHFNTNEQTVFFPFAGNYTVNFTAFTPGGAVYANPVNIKVDQNDSSFFSDPKWAKLTNGEAGKTWVLDMSDPIAWAALNFAGPAPYSGDWWWIPGSYQSWSMENKNWGEMTFDLNGGYNVKVVQTALNSMDQTTKTGVFTYDIAKDAMIFSGGPELLYGGDYYPDVSNWTTIKVIEINDTQMRLSVVRDQSRSGEGNCQIIFNYKVKPAAN